MKKIVVADDQKELLEMLVNVLKTNDEIEIVGIATNGEEEIECIKRYNPDVVITDLEMPLKTGLDVIKIFAEKENAPKFIVISGNCKPETMKKLNELSVISFSKPVDYDRLIEEILYEEVEIVSPQNLKQNNSFISKIKNLFSK